MLLGAGRSAEAAAIFSEIERDAPAGVSPEEARLRRAEALIALGKHDEAEAILLPLVTRGSRVVTPPAALMVVGSRIDRSLWVEAQQLADAAIARVPDSPWVARLLYRSAEAAVKEGKPDEARARFLKVATDHPRDAWAASAMLRSARLALDARDPAAALAIASEFPTKFPGNALKGDARLIEARAILAQDRPAEAVTILESLVADEKPGTDLAQAASYTLSLAYKAAGQPEKALALMEGLAKSSSPTAAEARLVIGLNLFEAKKYAEAAESLQAFLAARPMSDDSARALAYLALARKALGQDEAAQEALDRLARDFPSSDALVRSRLILAESALEARRYDEAAALFGPAAGSDDPKWKTRALSGLGWAQLQGGQSEKAAATFAALLAFAPTDPLAADAALARARALEAAGKADDALAALDVVSTTYGQSPEVQAAKVTRSRLLARAGKPAEAADELGAFLRDHPKAAPGGYAIDDLLVEWGWALHDAGKPAEADAAFARVLAEFPESPRAADARVFLAESLHAAGKPSEAEALLEPVVTEGSKGDPELVQSALLRLAKIALARGDAPASSARFDRLLREFPEGKYTIEARFGLAESELKGGKADSAEARFAELTRLTGPETARWAELARVRQIQCLVALERWDDVLKESDALLTQANALSSAPRAEIYYARGRALFVNARFDDALAAYDAATLAAPGTEVAARAQFMRGETYFHGKKYPDALREFHKTDLSYQVPEWQAAALLEAGKVYEALGRWTEAVDVYEKILASFPADLRIDQVKTRLGEARAKAQAPSSGE